MNLYQSYFPKAYEMLTKVVCAEVLEGQSVLDLGCARGFVCEIIDRNVSSSIVYCVDKDSDALDELRRKNFERIQVIVINEDVNSFLSEAELTVDAAIMNAALHEVSYGEKESYLRNFFYWCRRLNVRKILLGDYYFPKDISDEDVAISISKQLQELGHADEREKFYDPNMIVEVALKNDLFAEIVCEIDVENVPFKRHYIVKIRC